MFEWKKLGPIFNHVEYQGRSWMHEYAQAPSVLVLDHALRVFFSSRPRPDPNGQFISRLGYIDLDKADLFKIKSICAEPILPLGATGEFDEFGTYPVSTARSGTEIRAYYAGWTRCESVPFNAAIGLAVSQDDGATFTRKGCGPVLSYTPDEPFVLGSPKIRRFGDTWYLWYSSGRQWIKGGGRPEPVYKIRMAHSRDGIEWEKVGRNLLDDVLEENECQAGADVFHLDGKYHMLFSYRCNLNFRDAGRGYRTGYAFSGDLLHWTRADHRAGLTTSPAGWDSESVSYPHVFELNRQLYALYQGNEIGRFGFGLARLERYEEEDGHRPPSCDKTVAR